MNTQATKHKTRVVALALVSVSLFTQLLVLTPTPVAATQAPPEGTSTEINTGPSKTDIMKAGTFRQWARKCSNLGFTSWTPAKEYKNKDWLPYSDSSTMNVSTEIDSTVAGGNDEKISCEELWPVIAETVYGSRTKAIDALYDTSKSIQLGSDHEDAYPQKTCKLNGTAIDCSNPDYIKTFDAFKAESEKWADGILKGANAPFVTIYKKAEAVQTFKKCWEYKTDKDPKNHPKPDKDTQYDKDYYKRLHDTKSVGYLGEVYVEGGYDDGVANCDTTFDVVKKNDLLNFDASQAAKDLVNQAILEEVKSQLAANTDGLAFCTANTVLKYQDMTYIIDKIAALLVTGEHLTPRGTGTDPSLVIDDAKEAEIKDCVLTAYGEKLQKTVNSTPNPSGVGSTTSGSGKSKSCESDGGVLGWVLCAVADLLDNVTAWLDKEVQNLMTVSIQDVSDPALMKQAWSNIRNLAYIILIPMMLVMVIGTAIQTPFLDAYTVKKAFPRMVVAIFFIALSWYICIFILNFGNVLGHGVQGIILQPFNLRDASLGTLLGKAGLQTTGGTTVLLGIGGGLAAFAAGFASIGIILSGLFSLALVIGIAFVLLVARIIILWGLVLAAPIAILSWVFPGNDKLWKFWWGAFSKLVFLFPVIQAMIAMGKVFGWIVS